MGIWRSASPVLHSRPLTSSKSSGFSVVKRSRTPNERVCGWMEDGQTLSSCSFCFDSLHDWQTRAGGHCWRASRRAVTFVCQNIKSTSASTIAVCTATVQKKLQREIRSGEKQSLSLSLPLFLPARPYRHRVRKIIRDPFRPRLTCSAGFLLEGGHKMQQELSCRVIQMNSVISHCCFSDPQTNLLKTSQTETRDEVFCLEPACLTPGTSFVCAKLVRGSRLITQRVSHKIKSPQPVLPLYVSFMAVLLWGRQADGNAEIK